MDGRDLEKKQQRTGGETATVDVVVPVYNALDQVRPCLASLNAAADEGVRLIVVDDGSKPHVRRALAEMLYGQENALLLTNDENMGYLASVNRGLAEAKADIIVTQNSDTIVFPGFFARLRRIFASDPAIGVVNPVSVWANWTRVPFPPGHTIYSLARRLDEAYGDTVHELGSASGFSFSVRGSVMRDLDGFDPRYDPGYWEETDFCMRALEAGHRVVSAPGLFVFHHGWSSFGMADRNANMERNERIFRAQWDTQYRPLEDRFRRRDPLRQVRSNLVTSPSEGSAFATAGKDDLTVLYIVSDLALYGGVISIVQVVNQLVLSGVRAGIAMIGGTRMDALRYGPAYFSPERYEDVADFLDRAPVVDVAVATHWTTAYTVEKARAAGKARHTMYFVQDYEPDFHDDDPVRQRLAEASYHLIGTRVCKTPWLKRKLERFGGRNEIIPLGLNTDIFADHEKERAPMLVAMARPSTVRRNWPTTRDVFELLSAHRPDLALGVYGFGFKAGELPPRVENLGLLASASDVAAVLNRATILLDASTYQGFGRPGLEAIACGVVPVLTKNGGITSYARHMHNCMLVNPYDVVGIVQAIVRLLDEPETYSWLRENGRSLAQRYRMEREGELTHALLAELAGRPVGHSGDDVETTSPSLEPVPST